MAKIIILVGSQLSPTYQDWGINLVIRYMATQFISGKKISGEKKRKRAMAEL